MSSSRSSTTLSAAAVVVALLASTSSAQVTPGLVSKGCFSDPGSMSMNYPEAGYYMYQSSGWCQQKCLAAGKAVMGLNNKSFCYCGDELPPVDSSVDDGECNLQCSGWTEMCGGLKTFTVFLTGTKADVPYADSVLSIPSPSSDSSDNNALTIQSTAVQPITVTVGGKTIVQTITPAAPTNVALQSQPQPTQTSAPAPSGGSSTGSKVGIAVGVVVGVLGLVALVGGTYLLMKRRKLQHSRHNRNPSFVGFSNQGSPPASMTDSRLDPTMVERRNSIGSIFADNEDYSRRILRVANPTS